MLFAVAVLQYEHESTLPPKSDEDAMRFLVIFRSAPTGCNYLGYVRWACLHLSLSTHWFSEGLKMLMEGAKKLSIRSRCAAGANRQLLTEEVVTKLVKLADALGHKLWAHQALVAWECLFSK